MTVITVSRQMGSEGDAIAIQVAEELDLAVVDRDRLYRAALTAGVSEAALMELEVVAEQRLVVQVLRTLRSVPETPSQTRQWPGYTPSPLAGIFSPVLPPASIAVAELVHMLNHVIEKRARQGNVLFIGQGTQMLLRDCPASLHLRIEAPLGQRLSAVQACEGLSPSDALRKIRASDRERSEYVRRFHHARWDDAQNYHLVINTGFVEPAVAVKVIVAAVGSGNR